MYYVHTPNVFLCMRFNLKTIMHTKGTYTICILPKTEIFIIIDAILIKAVIPDVYMHKCLMF